MTMAYNGTRVAGTTTVVHTGEAWLLAVLVSHGLGSAQTVTVYNNTSASGAVVLSVTLPPNPPPSSVGQ